MGHGRIGPWRTLSTGVLIAFAAAFLVTLVAAAGSARLGYDFQAAYLPAADSLLGSGSPYSDTLREGEEWYVYPPQLALALVPFTLLPPNLATFLAFLGCLMALVVALAIVGVRDIRCYASVLMWTPCWSALEMANVSAVFPHAVAIVWRYRETVWRPVIGLGIAVSMKLFLWPLLVWELAAKRFRVGVLGAAIGIGLTAFAWAAIGFRGFLSYPDQLAKIRIDDSYSLYATTIALGGSGTLGTVVMAAMGGALLGAVVILGRRGEELRAFSCAIAAALALTPIVWQHYLVLVVVPLAAARPRFTLV